MSTNWKYRQELIKNADAIIELKQSIQCVDQPIYPTTTLSTNTPFLYKCCTEQSRPVGYETSNMKEEFLQKRAMQCRMIAPEIHYK